MPLFSEVLGEYAGSSIGNLANAQIKECKLDSEKRMLKVSLFSEIYIPNT